MRTTASPEFPTTIFYAFKQEESTNVSEFGSMRTITGWETLLKGLMNAGFRITATWPMRTERSGGLLPNGQWRYLPSPQLRQTVTLINV